MQPGLAIVSASPELFLRIDEPLRSRPVRSRAPPPIPRDLVASAKDHAENVMIVDLARNDLGRVCAFGSVQVPALFRVEAHPGLFHLVSTVTGQLRPDVDLADVIRATFPPASVTGAPKPRVMQAIEDLEPVRRGVYCGAIGWVDGDRGRAELSVAIRTFTIARGATYLGVGGGIVADSDPDAEWAETELKAARLLHRGRNRRRVVRPERHRRRSAPVIVWFNGELVPTRGRPRLAARPRARRGRRRVRDAARLRRSCRSRGPATSRASRRRPRDSASRRPTPRSCASRPTRCSRRNELREARLRITVTGGPAPPGSGRAPVPPTVIVVAFALEPTSATASVMVVPWTRNEGGALAGLKTISYAENVRALAYVEERGAHEAIFPNTQGNLCEATGSNVFLVLDGECITPPLVGRLPQRRDPPAHPRARPTSSASRSKNATFRSARSRDADEAFVSSTVREVQPIATVDGVTPAAVPRPDHARISPQPSPRSPQRDLDP